MQIRLGQSILHSKKRRVFQQPGRRNKLVFSSAGVVGLALVLAVVISSWQAIRAQKAKTVATTEAKIAKEQRQRAIANEFEARRNLYATDMNLARHALADNNLGHVVELLETYRPHSGDVSTTQNAEDLRGWEWRYLWSLCQSDESFLLGSHSNIVRKVAFSMDGRTVAAGVEGTARIWDIRTRREIHSVLHDQSAVMNLAFSRDSRWLATATFDNRVWFVECRNVGASFRHH